MADIDQFMQGLEILRGHVNDLRREIPDGTALPRHDLVAMAFEATNSTLEELRVAEEELRTQNEMLAAANESAEAWRLHYEDLFESAPDAYLVSDMNGVVQEANQAATRLLGLSKRFLKGKPLATFVPVSLRQGFRDLLTGMAQGQNPVEREIVWEPRRLPPVEAAVTISVVRDPLGRPLSLRWLVRNVTGRNEAEEERYRLLVAEVKDYAILLLDEEGVIVNWNPGAERIFGYAETEVRGHPVSMLFTAEDRANGVPGVELNTAAVAGRAEDERWHLRKDGTQFWASGVMTALRDKSGRLCWYAKVLRDFTARKEEQERLQAVYQREHRIAATFQRALLPEVPEEAFPGLAVNCQYEAAWTEAQVGGDFFDAFRLDGHVALVVGDVSGKGLAAAAHTAETKYALRAFLRETSTPALALTRLNTFLYDAQRLSVEMDAWFVTLCVLTLNPDTGETTVAIAGAEPPLILRADGTAEIVPVSGSLLGMDRVVEYAAVTATLAPGDTVIVGTDGITEARQGREFLDYDGLIRLAQEARSAPSLGEMGRAILDNARAFAGGSLADDACLLLARRV